MFVTFSEMDHLFENSCHISMFIPYVLQMVSWFTFSQNLLRKFLTFPFWHLPWGLKFRDMSDFKVLFLCPHRTMGFFFSISRLLDLCFLGWLVHLHEPSVVTLLVIVFLWPFSSRHIYRLSLLNILRSAGLLMGRGWIEFIALQDWF